MTSNDPFDRDLQSWLAAAARTTAPVGLHDAVIARVRGSRQRPSWLVALRGGALERSSTSLGRPALGLAYILLLLALIVAIVVSAVVGGAFRSVPSGPPQQLVGPTASPTDGACVIGPTCLGLLTPGRNGAIAYSVRDHSQRLPNDHSAHLVNADGTADRAIGNVSCPAFSKDGTVLVTLAGWEFNQLNVSPADGSRPQIVPGIESTSVLPNEFEYALSPDDTRIAWLKRLPQRLGEPSSQHELWVTPVSGGPAIRILTAPADPNQSFSFPVWAPDGRQIAFANLVSDTSGTYHSAISVINADGSNLRLLTTRPGSYAVRISWSPNGQSIAYDGFPDGSSLRSLGADGRPSDIFVINADGTGERNLTRTKSDDVKPEWSPDGAHLAYETNVDGAGYRLATIRMDAPASAGQPVLGPAYGPFTWSPDGLELLVLNVLYVLRRDSSVDSAQSTIESVDAEFRRPPTTLVMVDYEIDCAPSWQRVAP